MTEDIEGKIRGLNFGDRIDVYWYDASEVSSGKPSEAVETHVHSTGFYLGVKGLVRKHLVLAKEIINCGSAYHYNVILFSMIDRIEVIQRDALDPKLKKSLRRFVKESIGILRRKDGWASKENNHVALKRFVSSDSAEKKPKKLTKDERISSLEVRVAVLEERLQRQSFLEKIIWVLLATSLGKIVLDVLSALK